jgi:hypothetical protein
MRRPEPTTVQQSLDLATQALQRIRRDIAWLIHQAGQLERGYPASTRGSNGTSSDTGTIVERLALDDTPDIAARIDTWLSDVDDLVRHILAIDGRRANLLPADRDTTPKPDDETWCTNHLAAKLCEPRDPKRPAAGLCRWCADFNRENSQLPPARLLHLKAEKKRLTQRDVEMILSKEPKP